MPMEMGLGKLLLGVLVVTLCCQGLQGAEEHIGTVIGIDLGTTYSWYVLLQLLL